MPTTDKSTYKSFYGKIKLDEETRVAQLQAIAILTSPNPIAAEIAYLPKKDDTKKDENLGAVKLLLKNLKQTEDDEWTLTAASDSQFELDLHGMDAADRIYKLTGGDKLAEKLKSALDKLPEAERENEKNKDEYKPYAFSAEQYKAIQVYKRFLEDMKNMTSGVGTRFAEATLPKAVLDQLSHFALLKVMTQEDIDDAQKKLAKIEKAMKERTERYFSKANLEAQVKAGTLKPDEVVKTILLKQIYDNQLEMIKKQRLNHTSTKFHYTNTSIAATAFHTTAAVSNVLVAIATFVPVINLFAHPLKMGLEIVNYSLLIAAYNLDPKMKEGPNQYTALEREEIIQRRNAAKEHLAAIKTAKLKEVTLGLLGTAAIVGAFFAGPLAPLLAPIGAAGLLISNIYAQKAIQAEIDLLKKVGIKRDKDGNAIMEPVTDKNGKLVYENVITLKDGKEITETRIKQQEVRLMKDYDLRLAGLQSRLAAKKLNTYAAGAVLGGTLGTAAIAGAVLLGVASAAFPPLLIAIAAVTACVALFCAIKSVKKTYDEKQLITKADFQANRYAVTDMDKNLNKLSNQLNISPSIDMSKSLLALTDTFQHQKVEPTEAVSNKASHELSHENRNAPAPKDSMKDSMNEHAVTRRVESHADHLIDLAKPTASTPTAPTLEPKLSQEQTKEDKKAKENKEEGEGDGESRSSKLH